MKPQKPVPVVKTHTTATLEARRKSRAAVEVARVKALPKAAR
jgi:hypothetical protein